MRMDASFTVVSAFPRQTQRSMFGGLWPLGSRDIVFFVAATKSDFSVFSIFSTENCI